MSMLVYGSDTCKCRCSGAHGLMTDPMRARLHSHWKQDLFTDYTIHVEDREFRVHKLIMSSMSDFFQAMLTGGMSETGKDHVMLEGVSADLVGIMIHFIYSNYINITTDNATEILGAAIYFQIESAIKICTTFIIKNLTLENWFVRLTLFRMYALKDGIAKVEEYILGRLGPIVKSDLVVNLPYNDFSFVVKNWDCEEETILLCIQRWVSTNLTERHKYYDELLQEVRFCLMTPSDLLRIRDMGPINKNPDCMHSLIDKAIEYHKLPLHQRLPHDYVQNQVRSKPNFLTFVPEGSDDEAFFFNVITDDIKMWVRHEHLKTPFPERSIYLQTEVNNFLIVYAVDNNPFREQWYIFDPRIMKWEEMANLPRYAFWAVLVHSRHHLYAVGGEDYRSDPIKSTDTIEQYDFATNTWSAFSKLLIPLHAFGANVHDNGLYVAGGLPESYNDATIEEETLSTMDRLDLSTREWERKAPMLQKRRGRIMHKMRILKEEVLCFFEGLEYFEYYSPSEDQWSTLTFIYSYPPPKITSTYWVRGNSMFLSDTDAEMVRIFGKKDLAHVITFSEQGNEAIVDFVLESNDRFEGASLCNVLSVPFHSTDYQWTDYQV